MEPLLEHSYHVKAGDICIMNWQLSQQMFRESFDLSIYKKSNLFHSAVSLMHIQQNLPYLSTS